MNASDGRASIVRRHALQGTGRLRAATLALVASLAGIILISGTLLPPGTQRLIARLRGEPSGLAISSHAINAAGDAYGATTWYFAHGRSSTAPETYHTWLLLANPGAAAQATIQYRLDDGQVKEVQVEVPSLGRVAVYANQHVSGQFATIVSSTSPLVAEQSVFFANDGYTVPGVATPSTVWYLPEGFNGGSYDTTLHIYNPGATAADVTLEFFSESGQTQQVAKQVAGQSSLRLSLSQECSLSGGVSTRLSATQPVVVQRITHFPGRDGGQGGHASPGIALPSGTWQFPLALADVNFDTWFMLFNPGDAPVSVEARFVSATGETKAGYTIAPRSRTTIWLDKEKAEGRAPATSFAVTLTGNAPFAAESVIYDAAYLTGTSTNGAPTTARWWHFAEGSTSSPYTTYLALFNPGTVGAMVFASFLPSDLATPTPGWALLPGEVKVVNLNQVLGGKNAGFTLASDVPVVALRLMTMAGSGLMGAMGLPAEPPQLHPVAYLPYVAAPAGPTATPTPTRQPAGTPTPMRRADGGEYLLASAIAGTANCGTTGIKGRLTDSAGQPLPGLRVLVWADGWSGGYSNPSDGDGRWDFVLGSGARAGNWNAAVAREDGTLLSPTVYLPTSGNCRNGHQWLEVNWTQRQGAPPEYSLAWARRLSCEENSFNHNLFIDVTDSAGNGLPGISLRVSWDGGQTDIQTGLKPDVGPGRVEFPMYKGTYAVRVLSGSSDTATGLTVDLPDETVCDNHGNTLYHYSYHVVFRRN